MNSDKYDSLLLNGYEFDMNLYFSEGWQLFKKGAGSFIGFTLLYFVVTFAIGFIPFVNFLSNFLQYILLAGFYTFCRV